MATFEMHDDCDNRGGACSDCRNLRWSFERLHGAWNDMFEDSESLSADLEGVRGPGDGEALDEVLDEVQEDFDRSERDLFQRAGWSSEEFYEACRLEAEAS
jgi:hypothetical protein